jgi:hypothetical protein
MMNTAYLFLYLALSISISMSLKIFSPGFLKKYMTDSIRAEAQEKFLEKITQSGPDSPPKI